MPATPRVLIGGVFLLAAAGWAWFALERGDRAPAVSVRVRVLDAQGGGVPGAEVRTRYGGGWTRTDDRGEARLEEPRVKAGVEPLAALADALEARGTYHALRRDRRAKVTRAADGTYEAELRLEPCGLFRLAVAMTGFAEARAKVDPDPVRERWRVVEGNEVVRAGQAATWAVFPGAERLWVTLEGPQGTAQQRLFFPAPGPGYLLEKTLFPARAQPIAGRVSTGIHSTRNLAATLAGTLEVSELMSDGEPIPRAPVRIEDDGSFRVDYTGEGRFRLRARCPFLDETKPVEAAGGDDNVWIFAQGRPWVEIPLPDARRDAALGVVSLFAGDRGQSVLPEDGARTTERGLQVAAPGPGPYTVGVTFRGSDDAPPRAGEARVVLEDSGPVEAQVALRELPHGTLVVRFPSVPERGGEVRVLPDRNRTVLPRAGETATFRHVAVGTAFVAVRWQHPETAREVRVAEVRAGETTTLEVEPVRGGRLRLDATGTLAEDDPRPWALHLLPDATPYGKAEGTVPLLRAREDGTSFLLADGALRPGAYRAEVHVTTPDGPRPLPVAFEVRAGEETRVALKAP